MSQNARWSIGPIVLEALLVVFGVVLAFAANEWREARLNENRAERALHGIPHPAPLVSTAWTVAGATDVLGYLDYETVLAISSMYEEQETYEYQAREVGALIYESMFEEGLRELYHNYRNLFSIIGTFYYRECHLLDRYAVVLTDLAPRTY